VSFDATGGIVRLRSWAATFRHNARFASMSPAVVAFRKGAAFLAAAGLWQAAQFRTRTGRIVSENSSGTAAKASDVKTSDVKASSMIRI
jgi:hypothetical protein